MEEFLTVKETAAALGVSVSRVLQFIYEERLPAQKLGAYYVIKKVDLNLVKDRPVGRPPKAKD